MKKAQIDEQVRSLNELQKDIDQIIFLLEESTEPSTRSKVRGVMAIAQLSEAKRKTKLVITRLVAGIKSIDERVEKIKKIQFGKEGPENEKGIIGSSEPMMPNSTIH